MRNMRVVSRGAGATPLTGSARPVVAEPAAEDFTPVSAETFGFTELAVEAEAFDPSTLDYDPSEHTVADVIEYVEANPETADAVAELERNGKDRASLNDFFYNFNKPEG